MFERYTEKARRIIFYARYEASQHGSPYIEITHLLLGLVREDFPTVHLVSRVDRTALQQAIEALCAPSEQKIATSVDLPLSHPGKRVLGYAAEEAERMGHQHIGPEHMLLGVLREDGPEAKVLAGFGIELQAARAAFRTAATEPGAARQAVEKLLAEVPDDRLEAAARILAGLGSGYFAVGGVSTDGPFSYSFGGLPGVR
jgi:ATP-dependent Clp protease ATP-binding subunit ClpC